LKSNRYTCIDIGSYEIKLLVCILREERLFVLTQKSIKSMGIECGQITNFDKLVNQIKKIKELAELDLKQPLENLILTVSPISVLVESITGKINLDVNQPVNSGDIRQLFRQVMTQPHSETHLLVGLVPRLFKIDENHIQNPCGLSGMNLEVEAGRILMPTTTVSNLVHVVESSGFKVDEIIVGSISEALLALETPEMYARTCHINVGHSLTTLTVIHDGKILHARSLPVGGRDITCAIAEKFNISEARANELKVSYGKVLIDTTEKGDHQVIYFDDSQEDVVFITRGMLNKVVTEWTFKLFETVTDHIVEDLRLREKDYHYRLTGGMAELPHILHALQHQLPVPVSLYRPSMLGVRDTKFSSLVCVAIFAHELNLLLDASSAADVEQAAVVETKKEMTPQIEHILPMVHAKSNAPQLIKGEMTEITPLSEDTDKTVSVLGKFDEPPLRDERTSITDDYMDQKLGNSGVLVKFLDKIFNENEEETFNN